ncbi:MAG TPA: response regulator transcription factor [Saprospiraceae bacterium]|nr:response regulator transcription factor [Saprospiraceae bacterium]
MHVLLIEDELKTAESIRKYLEEMDVRVSVANDSETALQLTEKSSFDVIVSDVVLPSFSGIELVKRIRQLGIKSPVLMLSALSQTEDKLQGFEAGSDDYLAKPFDLKELYARIQALHRRSMIVIAGNNHVLSIDNLVLDLTKMEATRAGEKLTLTPREFKLLEFFLNNQGRVIPKLEILEKVWNLNDEINTNVIEVYVNYLRKKIEKPGLKKLIYTHFGIGYVMKFNEH